MRVLLTSTGLEAPALQAQFLSWLDKPPAQARALFIPTAAIDADAIAVLEGVGFSAMRITTGIPLVIPPRIPPQ